MEGIDSGGNYSTASEKVPGCKHSQKLASLYLFMRGLAGAVDMLTWGGDTWILLTQVKSEQSQKINKFKKKKS